MRRALMSLLVVAAGAFACPVVASACGTVEDWVARYERAGDDEAGRKGALSELAAFCGDYLGEATDRVLLPVLTDALERGEMPLVQLVFDRFRCLSALTDGGERQALAARLNGAACPTAGQRARWRVVTGDGVNLRAGPSRTAERLASLPRRTVLESGDHQGDWVSVTTLFGVAGYVHASLLAPLPLTSAN